MPRLVPALLPLLLAPVLALASPPDLATPLPGQTPHAFLPVAEADADAPPIDLAPVLAKLDSRFDAALAADPGLDEVVLSLNLDPEAAFALVHDRIATETYAGQLRDPGDVLTAGAGNDWDKSALLAEMLTRMGYAARLVSGPALPADAAPPARCGRPLGEETLAIGGLSPETADRVLGRASAAFAALDPLLAPADPAPLPDQPHVWVQYRRDGAWIDLDPARPDTAAGEAPAGVGAPATPPDPQRVILTLRAESLADGQLVGRDILSTSLDLPAAAHQSLLLLFGPATMGTAGKVVDALSVLDGQAGDTAAYLLVDGQPFKSEPFARPGATGAAEAGGDGGGPTTALTLIVTTTAPGLPDVRESRTILDLVPPDLREAAAQGASLTADQLSAPVLGMVLPAALESQRQIAITAGAASARRLAARTLIQVEGLPEMARRQETGDLAAEDLMSILELSGDRVAFLGESLLRAIPALDGACLVIDRPRVTILGWQITPDEAHLWIDWTLDSAGTRGGDARAAARLQLWHAALSAGLEREVLMTDQGLPSSALPLDAALTPLTGSADPMARDDLAAGFQLYAQAGSDLWWRIDPATGRADARGSLGNTFGLGGRGSGGMGPGLPRYRIRGSSVGRSWYLNAEEEAARNEALAAARRSDQVGKAAETLERRNRPGGNDYTLILTAVSIPISLALGAYVIYLSVDALVTWCNL